jgi:hypothetical protein
MARNYYLNGSCTAGTNKTAVEVVTTTAVRPKIYEILIGCSAAPASQAALWQLQRHTATGTGTAQTPAVVDSADPASVVGGKVNMTVEGTYTAGTVMWELPLNQQATYDFKANPGREFTLAASATAGAGLKTSTSTGTAVHQGSLYWEEANYDTRKRLNSMGTPFRSARESSMEMSQELSKFV